MRSHLLVLALAGCAGASDPDPQPPAPAPVFELGELVLYEGDEGMMKIHADGTTEAGYHTSSMTGKPGAMTSTSRHEFRPGPTLSPDGTIGYGGKPVAKLAADGTMTELRTGTVVPFTVTDERITTPDAGAIVLAADGTITVPNPEWTKPLRVVGADTPGKRRAVLAILALQVAVDPTPSTAPTPTVKVAPVAPAATP